MDTHQVQRDLDASAGASSPIREMSAEDFEYLAAKVYTYFKNRVVVERERHGKPGFALWR